MRKKKVRTSPPPHSSMIAVDSNLKTTEQRIDSLANELHDLHHEDIKSESPLTSQPIFEK
jgi:hypothetical protein